MKRFNELKQLYGPATELEILDFWRRDNIFSQTLTARKEAPAFTFYEGPPTANGKPGIHHVLGRTLKDTICRYKTMQGFYVQRKAGWDTHGLPVELAVEKALNLKDRAAIEAYGIANYNKACRDSVFDYKQDWDALTERIGYWVDLKNPYITCDNNYIESVWALIKRIHEKGLLYRGYKVQWYSPGTGTVLSSHEVSLGYKEVADPSVYVKFKIQGQTHEHTYFLAWTTTPWTLPANAALGVGEKITYVEIRLTSGAFAGQQLILAKSCLSVIEDEYEIVAEYLGKELVGLHYIPAFDDYLGTPESQNAWRVVSAEYVTTTDGTGVVHTAPAFGADDYATGLREGLPLLNPVDPQGLFTQEIALLKGLWFKDADIPVIKYLKEKGVLYKKQTIRHNYPHDWRKGTPLMSYPIASWFIRTTAIKDQLVDLNKTINWQPAGVGEGRFGHWLENNVDWAISRKRYWGTPLPIWMAEDSDHFEVIGSIKELEEKTGKTFDPATLDLHRPFVDHLSWHNANGTEMKNVAEVLDVWFDSGAMPFAQWHYPFENKDTFSQSFPADFICEGLDQTRGWFYTLHAIAALVEETVAYKNVVVTGLVLDENGEKMSKSKGNTIEPLSLIDKYGADVVRWYMLSNSQPWDSLRFAVSGLPEVQRRVFNTVQNVYNFFAAYANIEGFTYQEAPLPLKERSLLDQWILSRLYTVTQDVATALDGFNPTKAARSIEQFIDELSNWYVRRSRQRFWKEKRQVSTVIEKQDIVAAYQTLYETLYYLTQLMAPIAPFFSDRLYLALNEVTQKSDLASVHLMKFPKLPKAYQNLELEKQMALGLTVVRLVLGLRNQHNINVRQPLARVLLVESADVKKEGLASIEAIVLSEVNVKQLDYVNTQSEFVTHQAKPDFKKLGARFGKQMRAVQQAVNQLSQEQIKTFVTKGEITIEVENESVTLTDGEIVVTSQGMEGWLVEQYGDVTVALDTTIDNALRKEGLTREIINRIQQMRKTAQYNLTDRIHVYYEIDRQGLLEESLIENKGLIQSETLALGLEKGMKYKMYFGSEERTPDADETSTFEFPEGKVTLAIKKDG